MAGFSSIDKSTDFFNTKLYSGDGSTQAITGVGFQPDAVWLKKRSGSADHTLYDAVRGTTKVIYPNDAGQEGTVSGVTAFGSDGFTVGSASNGNQSGQTFVSWNWKAGTTSGITGSPSITPSSYSFNQTSGFSIIAYTGNGTAGATIPHGLGVAPSCVVIKATGAANSWLVGFTAMGWTKALNLNSTTAAQTATTYWNDTAPSSTLVTLGTHDRGNDSGVTYVAYCFADIQGFSKAGIWKGNGAANFNNRQVGPYIYTGFRPSVVISKAVDSATDWRIFDNKRDTYNTEQKILYPSDVAAEGTEEFANYYCNGFKIRSTSSSYNTNNENYVYLAFGQGLVGSNGVVGTAR